jgi:RNA polymerase sigma-70 factor (ECF subfamily)
VTDWNRIVREHGSLVFATAWRILGHAADSEDVVQDVFLEAYRLRTGQPVRHWAGLLRRLAVCRALDRLRGRRALAPLNDGASTGPGDDPEEAAIGHELAGRLREAIADLPQREAAVFCLRYFDDTPNQQIANILNISPGAVGVALHKARTRLEALLTEVAKGE